MAFNPNDVQNPAYLHLVRALSAAAILFERLSGCLWRALIWSALFAGIWLFALQAFHPYIGIGVFALFVFGCLYFLKTDFRSFRWPRMYEIDRRIEIQNGLKHRPLSAADDRPIYHEQALLWFREQRRKNRLLKALIPAGPRAFMAQKDPYAVRLLVLLFALCGFLTAGPQWSIRIQNGLTPFSGFTRPPQAASFNTTFWITPPEYTGVGQIVLHDTAGQEPLKIPQGSMAKATLKNQPLYAFFPPEIIIDEQHYPLKSTENGAYTAEFEIPKGERLVLKRGLMGETAWNYSYIPDKPPTISVAPEPETLRNAQLQFSIALFDDYGVQTLDMRMTLDPAAKQPPIGWPAQEERSVLSPAATDFQMTPVYDLSAHPWAGLPVVFTFTAHDHLEQIAQTAPLYVVLPERVFTHPVAQELVRIRKDLIWNPDQEYAEKIAAIENILYRPQNYNFDKRVFLMLRSTASRLYYNAPSIETAQSVMPLLWDIALRLEDGNLSLASRDLKSAQQDLENALKNPNASPEEIAALMARLRETMGAYLQSMVREWQKNMAESGQQMPQFSPEMLQNMMNMDDLAAMLGQMENDILSGDRNAAQQMLSQLQRLTDMLNPSLQTSLPPDMQMMQEGLQALQELIERQEALLEQTQKQAEMSSMLEGLGVEKQPEGQVPFVNLQNVQREQNDVRRTLGDLMLKADQALGQIPENMGLAEQSMRNAGDDLQNQDPANAVSDQEEALQHLKDSQQQMAEQFVQRMQQMTGFAMGGMPQQLDPLGRPIGEQEGSQGQAMNSNVKIPGRSQQKWVRDILNELRRRAGQRDRPHEVLEYYQRLLRRF